MKNIIFGALLLISLNSFADGCSGAATFSATYNSAQCCWTFINTTNNDCGSNGYCTWNFGDGSPTITTTQGASTICHQFPSSGTYTVSLTYDANSCYPGAVCTGFYSVTVTAPQLTVNSPIICLGQTTTLTASPSIAGGSYLWSNSQTTPSIVVTPTITTNYTVQYSISGCSPISRMVTVTVLPLPVVSIQATTVCSDAACGLTLGGPPGGTYNIITINSNGLSSSAGTPLVANGVLNSNLFNDAWTNTSNAPVNVIYTIVPISAIGCIGTPFTVTLTINPEPLVSNQDLTVCSDVFCSLTLGNDINGPTVSTYNITNINSNGLSSSAGLPLVANGVLNSNLFNDAWTNTSNAPVDVIYTLVPIIAAACNGNPFTVTLTINPEPVVLNQATTVCSDVACGLTLGGPPGSTYNILSINSNSLSTSAGNPLVANGVLNSNLIDDAWTNTTNAPLDVIYTIVPISAAGCEGTPFTVTLTINPEPVVLNQATTVCSDVSCGLTLGDDIDGPTASTYNIISLNSNGFSSSAGTPLVANGVLNSNLFDDSWTNTTSAPVDVIYTIVPISAAGCEGSLFTVTLTINPEPFISDQVLTVCSDVASGLSLGDDLDGPAVSFYEIASINFNGLSSSAGNPIIGINFSANEIIDDAYNNLSNTSINVEYNVIPTGVNSCIGDPYTVIITVNPEPIVSDQSMTVCSEELIGTTLPNDANGPNIQSWNITNILIGDSLIPNSGNVTLGSTIYNQHIAGDIYLNTSTSGSFDVIYSVVPTSINNCIGELFTITITVHPNPIANFTDICGSIPATLTNTSTGAVNYYWDMGDGSPIITNKDISYIYTIMDSMYYNIILIAETEFGCLDTASKIFTPPLLFYVPNTFTPDGDEFNNTFIPVFSNKNKVESIHLLIYNRWGELVFESENINFGWDGTYKNRIAQDGTYTWELIFTNNSCIGKKEHLYGHVNLIR